jgi:RNA polymerase sigma factor (sigma-70 family)
MDEKALIKALILGQDSAYSTLFDTYGILVYNVALKIMQNKEDAEDIVQEVFAEVVKSISKFKNESSLKTWLYKITSNKALDTLRKRNRKKRFAFTVSKDSNTEAKQVGHFIHPGVQLEQKEMVNYLYLALSKLPERQQLAFTLHKMEGLSYKEICDIMETTLPTVETLIHRAKKQLQVLLASYYATLN